MTHEPDGEAVVARPSGDGEQKAGHTPPKPESLTTSQRWLAVATGLASTALAVLGGIGSFDAVRQVAADHGIAHPWRVPLYVDLGVLAGFNGDLLLEWLDMSFPPLRWIAHALVGATIWFNVAASWGDPLGMAMHAVAPLIVVIWVEGVRHAIRTRARMAKRRRHIESAQLARWLLAPVATAKLWRRQQLWNVANYADALRLERRRVLAIARMRAEHGCWWRVKAPVMERLALRLGFELEDQTSLPAASAEQGPLVELERDPTDTRTAPDAAAARATAAAGAERAAGDRKIPRQRTPRASLRERVETAFLTREIGNGEELVGAELAREIDGDDQRKRRVQEVLNQLRHRPTDEQRARIAAAREAADRPAGRTLTAVPAVGEP